MVCADDGNILGESIHTTKKSIQTLYYSLVMRLFYKKILRM